MVRRSQHLRPLSQTTFESPAPEGFPTSCPVLDLSATIDSSGCHVLIYRPDGEQVCKLQQGGRMPSSVTATRWKSNGQFIAVAWKDGIVRLMGLETSKAAHHIPVLTSGMIGEISFLAWMTTKIALEGGKSEGLRSELAETGTETAEATASHVKNAMANLPLEMMFLELDISLPKLSPLPTTSAGSGEDALVFTQRSGVDFMFQPFNRSDAVEISLLLAGLSDGSVHLSIHDSLPIGSFVYPPASSTGSAPGSMELIHHASHHALSPQMLIFKNKDANRHSVEIVPLDLQFVEASPINLTLLASKLTMMHKLLRYIKQTVQHIQVEYNNTRDLPTRFVNSATATLDEDPALQQDVVTALYQAVLTGNLCPKLKEWLMDSMGDRNLKRWTKAVTGGLTGLQCLAQQHLLPALDRLNIIVSRLTGLSAYHSARHNTGLQPNHLGAVLDLSTCLSLITNRILLCTMEELKAWKSFSAWMMFTLEKLNSPSTADDLSEKHMIDTSQVVLYLVEFLRESPMKPHISTDLGDGTLDEVFMRLSQGCTTSGKHIVEVFDGMFNGNVPEGVSEDAVSHFLQFGELTGQLERSVRKILDSVAVAQKSSVRFGEPVVLELGGEVSKVHSQMVLENPTTSITYASLLTKNDTSKITLSRTQHTVTRGISSLVRSDSATIAFPSAAVIDIQILNDKLLALVDPQNNKPHVIYTIPLPPVSWGPPDAPPAEASTLDILIPMALPDGFKPVSMEVYENSNVRNHLPARVCLLEKDRLTWKTFALEMN